MNSDVRPDQIISVSLAKNTEQVLLAVFTTLFCFTHAEHDNLIKIKLCNYWSAQAVNSISKCPMWNSKKPIKFAYL